MRHLTGSRHFSLTASDSAAFSASETVNDSDNKLFITDIAASTTDKKAYVSINETDSAGDTKLFDIGVCDDKEFNHSFQTPLIISSGKYLKVSCTDVSSDARVNVSGFEA
jgi:hypothetical protein